MGQEHNTTTNFQLHLGMTGQSSEKKVKGLYDEALCAFFFPPNFQHIPTLTGLPLTSLTQVLGKASQKVTSFCECSFVFYWPMAAQHVHQPSDKR
jgi:hypothetical protein